MANLGLLDSDQRSPAVTIDTARAIASEYIARDVEPEDFDAELVLRERPELRDHKSVVLDLAYEEFLRKAEAGQAPQVSQFAARFPEWQVSLLRMLQVHDFLNTSPDLTTITWPQVDDNFAGFQLCQELGRGAFSRVFLARELGVGGRTVVVKAVSNVYSDADTLGRLQHPHLVPVYSVSHDEVFGLTAICMPYLGRATLFDVLQTAFDEELACPRQGIVLHEAIEQANQNDEDLLTLRREYPYSGMNYVDAILEIAIQLAQALKYIHRRGIYHCDIKPSNVLLTASGEAKLFDFNLALADDTPPEQVGGTLAYMAPELLESFADGRPAGDIKIDGRTDLFSFGVMLFELLAGKLPFELPADTEDRRELARRLLRSQNSGPIPLSKANPSVGHSLATVIEKSLAASPAARPASATEFLELLQAEQARRRRRSRRRFVAAAVSGGILLVSGATAGAALFAGAESALDKGRKAFEAGKYQDAAEHFTQAVAEHPTNLRVHLELAHAHLYAGNYSDALRYYLYVADRGLEDDEVMLGTLRARFHYGRELIEARHFDEAHDRLRDGVSAIQNRPEFQNEREILDAYRAVCLAMSGEDNHSAALSILQSFGNSSQLNKAALKNNIGHLQAKVGRKYRRQGDRIKARSSFDAAKESFQAAIEVDSRQRIPHRNLAYVHLDLCEVYETEQEVVSWCREAVNSIDATASRWGRSAEPDVERYLVFYDAMFVAARAADLVFEFDAELSDLYVKTAVDYASEAKQAGLGMKWFHKIKAFGKRLWENPEYQELLPGRDNGNNAMIHRCMMDPLVAVDDAKSLGQLYIPR